MILIFQDRYSQPGSSKSDGEFCSRMVNVPLAKDKLSELLLKQIEILVPPDELIG